MEGHSGPTLLLLKDQDGQVSWARVQGLPARPIGTAQGRVRCKKAETTDYITCKVQDGSTETRLTWSQVLICSLLYPKPLLCTRLGDVETDGIKLEMIQHA